MHFFDFQSIREVSARISHLEQVLKEKSTDLEKTEDLDEKEALRHEIQSLRKTKECLSKERCGLDEKLQKVSQGFKEQIVIHY
jgi:predicted  nucleic acid-binding Zn-ribbon protein